jgi:hypothetical protein
VAVTAMVAPASAVVRRRGVMPLISSISVGTTP